MQGKASTPKWAPWKKLAPPSDESDEEHDEEMRQRWSDHLDSKDQPGASANTRQATALDAMQTAADMVLPQVAAEALDGELGRPSPKVTRELARSASRIVDVAAQAAATARGQEWTTAMVAEQDWSDWSWTGDGHQPREPWIQGDVVAEIETIATCRERLERHRQEFRDAPRIIQASFYIFGNNICWIIYI